MKTSTVVLIVALAVSVVVNLAGVGAFFIHKVRRTRPPGRELFRHADPEDREELRALRREFGRKMDSMHKELGERQRELTQLLRDGETRDAEVDALAQEIGRLHAEMTVLGFNLTKEIAVKLPPERQEKLLRRFERQYDRHHRRGHREGRRGSKGRRGRRGRKGERGAVRPGEAPPPPPPGFGPPPGDEPPPPEEIDRTGR